jgi:leucyl aminopeptidase
MPPQAATRPDIMTKPTEITFGAVKDARERIRVALSESAEAFPAALRMLDERSGGQIARAARVAKFSGGKKAFLDLIAPGGIDVDRLLILGTGASDAYSETDWLNLGGRIRARLAAARASSADLLIETGEGRPAAPRSAALIALGMMLRGYEFKKYKKKKKVKEDDDEDPGSLNFVRILCHRPQEAAAQFEALRAVGEGVKLARDLINEPPNVLYPEEFAQRVKALASAGLDVEILDQGQLAAIGMDAILAVGQGSARASCVAIMRWNGGPQPDAKPLVLIGKGVCFDTGGISIKPAAGMEDMKGDMGGAAAVTGAMLALAKRKAPVNVIGLIGLTENMPSGTAQRPGDIITTLSGQTVEVVNTDAEGRLVLADVMWYAQEKFEPKAMVTLATLTGAVIIALGKVHAGLFANDDALSDQLAASGRESGEKVWRLPLDPKYDKMLNSKVADMKNIGGRDAGSITAAQFLQRFVKPDVPWAHLDIAGTAIASPATDINASWASGFGVMLLDRLASKFQELS